MSTTSSGGFSGRTLNQTLALAIGAAYLLAGLAGFLVTGFNDFFGHDTGEALLGFGINPFHNIVHLLIGAAGLVLARTVAGARTFGLLLLVGYGAALLYGLFAVNADWDILNINWADNVLHLVSALAGAFIAFYGRNRVGHSTTPGATRPVR